MHIDKLAKLKSCMTGRALLHGRVSLAEIFRLCKPTNQPLNIIYVRIVIIFRAAVC